MAPVLKPGIAHLGFLKLTPQDFGRILNKLGQKPQDQENQEPPLKKARGSEVDDILSKIPTRCGGEVSYLNFVGNSSIGDEGIVEHLHRLPSSVKDLDLSDCGMTSSNKGGIRALCQYMKTNTSITRLIMWGNEIGEAGATFLGDMLKVNETLQELCIHGSDVGGVAGMRHLASGLRHNKTLRSLSMASMSDLDDECLKELCLAGLAHNQGLKKLDLMGNYDFTNTGLIPLERALYRNYTLTSVTLSAAATIWDDEEEGADPIRTGPDTTWNQICFWKHLNKEGREKLLDPMVPTEDCRRLLVECHRYRNLDGIFSVLQDRPDLCNSFASIVTTGQEEDDTISTLTADEGGLGEEDLEIAFAVRAFVQMLRMRGECSEIMEKHLVELERTLDRYAPLFE